MISEYAMNIDPDEWTAKDGTIKCALLRMGAVVDIDETTWHVSDLDMATNEISPAHVGAYTRKNVGGVVGEWDNTNKMFRYHCWRPNFGDLSDTSGIDLYTKCGGYVFYEEIDGGTDDDHLILVAKVGIGPFAFSALDFEVAVSLDGL